MAKLSKLSHLMQVLGAVAAGEFSDDGKLLNYTATWTKSPQRLQLLWRLPTKQWVICKQGWTVYTGKDGFFQ